MKKKNNYLLIYFAIAIYLVITLFNILSYCNGKILGTSGKTHKKEIKQISCERAFVMLSNHKIFIDVRDENSFKYVHIKSALNFPYYRNAEWIDVFTDKFDYNDTLIVYCDSDICGLSISASNYLIKKGYKNIFVLIGGIDKWEEKGLPLIQLDG